MASKNEKPAKKGDVKKESKGVVLNVADRLLLSMMFKNVERDSFVGFLIGKHIVDKVQFSSEEVQKLDLRPEEKGGGLKWNPDVASECAKEVVFTDQEKNHISQRYAEVGKDRKSLTKVHMALWEKLNLPEPDVLSD